MSLAVLTQLDAKRNAAIPIYQHLAEQIMDRVKSGKLIPGYKMPTEPKLASQLGISRFTVRKTYQVLESENLIERRRGMGTFIKDAQKNTHSTKRSNNTIYILIPHPIHITLQFESSLKLRRILYGLSIGNSSSLIQTVPVSQKLESSLAHIDWDMVRQIPEGAQVFVSGMWFKNLFPFLLKRNILGIFLDSQQDCIEYPKEYRQLIEAKWNFITVDRFSAMEQSVEYFYNLGRRQIAVVKLYKNEPQHPFRQGMIAAYKKCGMPYCEDLYLETEFSNSVLELENKIVELWENTKFDALIVGCADSIKPIYKALTKKLGLRIPDDVALMSFSDSPVYLDFDTAVTAIDFPNVNLGQEIVNIFKRKNFTPSKSIFQATIIERESSRKGTGAYVNHAFMPEISANNNIVNIN